MMTACGRIGRSSPSVCSLEILDGSKIFTVQSRFLQNPVAIAQVAGIIDAKTIQFGENAQ